MNIHSTNTNIILEIIIRLQTFGLHIDLIRWFSQVLIKVFSKNLFKNKKYFYYLSKP